MSGRVILKARTDPSHRRTEALFWGAAGFRDRSGYDRFLVAMEAAHRRYGAPAARRLEAYGVLQDEPRLLSALAADRAERASPPRALSNPAGLCDSAAWGAAYALAGSALGAATMLRSPSLRPGWPRRYLTASAARARDGSVRRAFAAMEAAAPDWEQAAAGALAVFSLVRAVGAGAPDLDSAA